MVYYFTTYTRVLTSLHDHHDDDNDMKKNKRKDDKQEDEEEEETSMVEMMIYMGEDKYENEKLIKYGWDLDVWFHVDDLSSAHVYLRLPRASFARQRFRETGKLDHLPDALLDCCALVKANSIDGSKKTTVNVVYTPFENLKKTSDMVDGQVGFVDPKKVITVRDVEKNREHVNRLNKTKIEKFPDLEEEKRLYDLEVMQMKKERARKLKQIQKEEEAKMLRLKEEKEKRYDALMDPEKMRSNQQVPKSADVSAAKTFEDDFM